MGDSSLFAGGAGGGGLEVLLQAAEFVEQKPTAGIDSSPSDRSIFDGIHCFKYILRDLISENLILTLYGCVIPCRFEQRNRNGRVASAAARRAALRCRLLIRVCFSVAAFENTCVGVGVWKYLRPPYSQLVSRRRTRRWRSLRLRPPGAPAQHLPVRSRLFALLSLRVRCPLT